MEDLSSGNILIWGNFIDLEKIISRNWSLSISGLDYLVQLACICEYFVSLACFIFIDLENIDIKTALNAY